MGHICLHHQNSNKMLMTETFELNNIPNPATIKRPGLLNEFNSMWQPLRLLSQYRSLTKRKTGNGERIILLPGWKSHHTVMYPVKRFLTKLGYAPEYWGLGINHGYVERYRDQLLAKLKQEKSTEKVVLIGWSLGGTIAREIAREMPDKVASVITYGSPVIGGPKHTAGAKVWDVEETARIDALMEELDEINPIQVPMSIIFTKKDSIVSWSACIDQKSKNAKHYEVNSTHLSLGIDPSVWRIIAHHLQHQAFK